jgi:hypothetical protein
MTTTAATSFELERFCRAAEQRDTQTQLAMYAPDATVTIADRVTQPGSPRVLHKQAEIRAWLDDVGGREMSHTVLHKVRDDSGAAFTEACRYPDGTNVLCATVLELSDGQITRQTVVQAWDEK